MVVSWSHSSSVPDCICFPLVIVWFGVLVFVGMFSFFPGVLVSPTSVFVIGSQSVHLWPGSIVYLKINECMDFRHQVFSQPLPFSRATSQNQTVLLYLYPRFHGSVSCCHSSLSLTVSETRENPFPCYAITISEPYPLSLYFCHSMQYSSHMVLFTCLALAHHWKVAFELQHRKPNYIRPIHTHAHTETHTML